MFASNFYETNNDEDTAASTIDILQLYACMTKCNTGEPHAQKKRNSLLNKKYYYKYKQDGLVSTHNVSKQSCLAVSTETLCVGLSGLCDLNIDIVLTRGLKDDRKMLCHVTSF